MRGAANTAAAGDALVAADRAAAEVAMCHIPCFILHSNLCSILHSIFYFSILLYYFILHYNLCSFLRSVLSSSQSFVLFHVLCHVLNSILHSLLYSVLGFNLCPILFCSAFCSTFCSVFCSAF